MNFNTARQKLDGKFKFTLGTVFSNGFHGNAIVFDTVGLAWKAYDFLNLDGTGPSKHGDGKWAFYFYG